MPVSMDEVRKLREITGAGILDCKKALEEAEGDIERAKDILKIKGLAKAEKKAGRETKEGIIYTLISLDCKKGVIIELNCETDFVARNEEFKILAKNIAEHILEEESNRDREGTGEDISDQNIKNIGKRIVDYIKEFIAKIGENIQLKRFSRYDAKNENKLHSYIHGEGRIGVLVEYSVVDNANDEIVERIIRDIAMQIAAMRPEYISIKDIPQEVIEREKKILIEQAKNEGKPDHIIEKVVEGRLKKTLKEKVLLEQVFIKDEKRTVADMLNDMGNRIKVIRFVRYELGGI